MYKQLQKKNVLALSIFFTFSSFNVFADTFHLVTLESPPAEYIENNQPKGINVDIVNEVLRRMGHDCVIEFVPWQRAISMVKNGSADGIIDAAFKKERAEYLHYPSEEIYIEEWYCFKRKSFDLTFDEGISNAGEISLGISRGFVYGGLIQDLIVENKFKSIQSVPGNELNIKKLVRNRFDAFVGVKATILYISKKLGYIDEIEVIKKTGTDTDYLLSSSKTYLGFSKQTIKKEIADKFSKVLTEMKEDGTFAKITKKYY